MASFPIMKLATRCPSCNTVFRVVQEQLKVSDGWVRCGRCQHVFSALERLFDLGGTSASPAPAAAVAAQATPAQPEPPHRAPSANESPPPSAPTLQAMPSHAAAAADAAGQEPSPAPPETPKLAQASGESGADPEEGPHPTDAPSDTALPAVSADFIEAAGAPVAAAVAAAVAGLDDRQDPLAGMLSSVSAGSVPPSDDLVVDMDAVSASPAPVAEPEQAAVALIEPDSAVMELEEGRASELQSSKFTESDFVEDAAVIVNQQASDEVIDCVEAMPLDMQVPEAEREAVAAQGPPELTGRPAFSAEADHRSHRSQRRSGWQKLDTQIEDAVVIDAAPVGLKRPSKEARVPILDTNVSRFPQWEPPPVLPRADAEKLLREGGATGGSSSSAAAASEFIRHTTPSGAMRRRRSSWTVRAALSAMVLVLSATLVFQIVIQWRDDLVADYPDLAPALTETCDWLGCGIEPPKRIQHITVESSGLTKTGQGDIYQLSVVLRNRSDVVLTVPMLDLTLTDAEGGVISRRMLVGNEMHAPSETIAAQGDMSLHTLLTTPGKNLVGYTLEVFYP